MAVCFCVKVRKPTGFRTMVSYTQYADKTSCHVQLRTIQLFRIVCNRCTKDRTRCEFNSNVHTRTCKRAHTHYHKKNCNRILQLFQWLPSLSHTQLRALIHDKLSHLIHDKSSEGQIEMRKLREKKGGREKDGRGKGIRSSSKETSDKKRKTERKQKGKKAWRKRKEVRRMCKRRRERVNARRQENVKQ